MYPPECLAIPFAPRRPSKEVRNVIQATGVDQLLQRGLEFSAFDARQQMRFKPERPEVRPWSKVEINAGDIGDLFASTSATVCSARST